uniref:Mitochondrial cardiolipin hydrolase n=1 Tax=Anopheles minimus TaxID=112268 RepID=A0A182WLR5_9DIPT
MHSLVNVINSKAGKLVVAGGLLFVTTEIVYELYLWLRKSPKPKPKPCEVYFINRRKLVHPLPSPAAFLFEHINRIVSHIDRAEKSICLAMYIFTVREISEAVIRAKKRSVIVRVVTCESMVGNEGSYLRDLIEEDIKVQYKYKCEYLMHHKFCLLDTEWYCGNCLIAYHIAECGEPTKYMQHTLFDKAVLSDRAGLLDRFGRSCSRCNPQLRVENKQKMRREPNDACDPLPKHGLLIAGSSNWTSPGLVQHWDNITYCSLPEMIDPFTAEFQRMWYELGDALDKTILKEPLYRDRIIK